MKKEGEEIAMCHKTTIIKSHLSTYLIIHLSILVLRLALGRCQVAFPQRSGLGGYKLNDCYLRSVPPLTVRCSL